MTGLRWEEVYWVRLGKTVCSLLKVCTGRKKKTLSSFRHHGLWLWIQELLGIFVTMREASQRTRATFGEGHGGKGSLENRVGATGFGQPWGLATTLSTSGLPHASNTFPYYWSLVMSSSLSWAAGSTSNWYNKQLYQYCLWTISPSQDGSLEMLLSYAPAPTQSVDYLSILRLTSCCFNDYGLCHYYMF